MKSSAVSSPCLTMSSPGEKRRVVARSASSVRWAAEITWRKSTFARAASRPATSRMLSARDALLRDLVHLDDATWEGRRDSGALERVPDAIADGAVGDVAPIEVIDEEADPVLDRRILVVARHDRRRGLGEDVRRIRDGAENDSDGPCGGGTS